MADILPFPMTPPRQQQPQFVQPGQPLHENMLIAMPMLKMPGHRYMYAAEKGCQKNLLIKNWGGIGDQACGEAVLRYALKYFKGFDISLAALNPQLFQHLKFKKVYNLGKGELPDWLKYYVFDTHGVHNDLPWQFICHIFTNCVDAASLYAFRCQLPIEDREIKLVPNEAQEEKVDRIIHKHLVNAADEGTSSFKRWVIVHPGQHWQSKTFPKWWWDKVLTHLKKNYVIPVLVGGHLPSDDKDGLARTTVDVNTEGCLDLRGELELMETVALIQRSNVVLTNDSCVLHLAAPSDAWIGYITLVKHPDYVTHYRHGEFGWRMKNFGKDGIWNERHMISGETIHDIGDKVVEWLPEPEQFANWAIERA